MASMADWSIASAKREKIQPSGAAPASTVHPCVESQSSWSFALQLSPELFLQSWQRSGTRGRTRSAHGSKKVCSSSRTTVLLLFAISQYSHIWYVWRPGPLVLRTRGHLAVPDTWLPAAPGETLGEIISGHTRGCHRVVSCAGFFKCASYWQGTPSQVRSTSCCAMVSYVVYQHLKNLDTLEQPVYATWRWRNQSIRKPTRRSSDRHKQARYSNKQQKARRDNEK